MRPSLLLLCLLATPIAGQTVTLTRIADATTPVKPFAFRMGLHAGEVTLLGKDAATGLDGIWKAPTSGLGAFAPIAKTGDPIPGGPPGAAFNSFLSPQIFDGAVLFFGSQTGGGPAAGGGFVGDGQQPLVPQFGAGAQSSLSEYGLAGPAATGAGGPSAVFVPWGGTAVEVLWDHGDPVPGGGTLASIEYGDVPAIHGRTVVAAARVNHGPGNLVDSTLVGHDIPTGAQTWYANWTTLLPGLGQTIDVMLGADTDGEHVVFGAYRGAAGQGGVGGIVRVAASATDGAGPLEKVAYLGDPGPDGGTLEYLVGPVVSDGTVVFGALKDSVLAPTAYTVYAWRAGQTVRVLSSGDTLGGKVVATMDFNHRAFSGNELGLHVVFTDSSVALYVARLEFSPNKGCPGSGGFVPALVVTGDIEPGGAVALGLRNGLGGAPALLLFGTGPGVIPMAGGCAVYLGGLLPLQVPLVLPGSGPGAGDLDLAGTLPAGLTGYTLGIQLLVADALAPAQVSASPAVFLEP
jgi:hypothetical protein